MKVLVLGSTGMLGQAVMEELAFGGMNPIGVARGTDIPFDALSEPFESLAERVSLAPGDYVVNCIGWIPQKATHEEAVDEEHALRLNVGLIEELDSYSRSRNIHWIQIGTDCIFDGADGNYDEDSSPTPNDLYGRTKLAGEQFVDSAIFLRCSIVGPDEGSKSGLYEWFKSRLASGGEIHGYTNHLWNGVTTLAFARLTAGLLKTNWTDALKLHWIPEGNITKADLLRLFCNYRGVKSKEIVSALAPISVNRILSTNQQELNARFWSVAGYKQAPSIEELIREMVEDESRTRNG